jgi:thiol-disulfide isomerase/thioredoxin
VGQTASLPPSVNGFLAGQVMDRHRKNPGGVVVQVVDLQEQAGSKAPLEVEVDPEGFFKIPGLEPGRQYQLIARTRDGGKLLTGATYATPPNPRIAILLGEDAAVPAPGLPREDKPKEEGVAAPPVSGGVNREGRQPAVILDRPRTGTPILSPDTTIPPATAQPGIEPVEPPLDPSRMAIKDGFARDPTATIPGPKPGPTVPPVVGMGETRTPAPPPWSPPLTMPSPPRITPPVKEEPRVELPATPMIVPSCVLVGKKLHDFALDDANGLTWQYRQQRKGKLLLIDFWATHCVPCVRGMPHLQELLGRYGPSGLQLIGIAYERGPRPEQARRVQEVGKKIGVSYPLLLGGGGKDICPVQQQFNVRTTPTLVLLDGDGTILWRGEAGTDPAGQLRELEWMIQEHLGLRLR